ncbi:3'-5' exonuclease, partial [Bacillus cereus group sp. Bce021]|uniref:3'-5' exonuclease n=1 Tax=Bacillus cereus group sp. Bce021 TaxID=3445245 RepID=UPI003F21E01F
VSGVKFLGNGQLIDTRTHLINPEIPIPSEVTAIHGITDDMVKGLPGYRDIIPDFINWMANSGGTPTVFVAHNAAFDIGFLQVG